MQHENQGFKAFEVIDCAEIVGVVNEQIRWGIHCTSLKPAAHDVHEHVSLQDSVIY